MSGTTNETDASEEQVSVRALRDHLADCLQKIGKSYVSVQRSVSRVQAIDGIRPTSIAARLPRRPPRAIFRTTEAPP